MPTTSAGGKPYLSKVRRSQVFSVITSCFRLSVLRVEWSDTGGWRPARSGRSVFLATSVCVHGVSGLSATSLHRQPRRRCCCCCCCHYLTSPDARYQSAFSSTIHQFDGMFSSLSRSPGNNIVFFLYSKLQTEGAWRLVNIIIVIISPHYLGIK